MNSKFTKWITKCISQDIRIKKGYKITKRDAIISKIVAILSKRYKTKIRDTEPSPKDRNTEALTERKHVMLIWLQARQCHGQGHGSILIGIYYRVHNEKYCKKWLTLRNEKPLRQPVRNFPIRKTTCWN